MAFSTSYKLFGHRKDQLGKVNGEYAFNSTRKHSTADINHISSLYCNLSCDMARATHRIGNSLYETGVYEIIQSHSSAPSVGVPKNVEDAKRKKPWKQILPLEIITGVSLT